jgi:hypothetical protein
MVQIARPARLSATGWRAFSARSFRSAAARRRFCILTLGTASALHQSSIIHASPHAPSPACVAMIGVPAAASTSRSSP